MLSQVFDDDGALDTRTLAGGRLVDVGFDAAGRQTSVDAPEADDAFTYAGATERLATATRTPATGPAQVATLEHQGDMVTRLNRTGAAAGDARYTYGADLDVTSWTLDGGPARSLARDGDRLTVADGRGRSRATRPGGTRTRRREGPASTPTTTRSGG